MTESAAGDLWPDGVFRTKARRTWNCKLPSLFGELTGCEEVGSTEIASLLLSKLNSESPLRTSEVRSC